MSEAKGFLILESGNKQVLCKKGDKILVDLLPVNTGETVDIKVIFEDQKLVNKTIKCSVLEAIQLNEKVRIYKHKRRKGYERNFGFRKKYTELLVGGTNGNA